MNAGGREFFSATSNVPFRSEEELHEHYRSAFHRYNLKRRVAGLGPVTKEWFDTHRDKLVLGRSAEASQANNNVIYYDPLSKKSFSTQAKYLEFTNSNKYKKLVKANGGVRPEARAAVRPHGRRGDRWRRGRRRPARMQRRRRRSGRRIRATAAPPRPTPGIARDRAPRGGR